MYIMAAWQQQWRQWRWVDDSNSMIDACFSLLDICTHSCGAADGRDLIVTALVQLVMFEVVNHKNIKVSLNALHH